MSRQSANHPNPAPQLNTSNELSDFEEASSRATRARTRLIVEGYSNLALIAILFTGVQAQLISVTNEQNTSALEIATNAVFFGGLMFSVFTAVLAVLSGRWFSILREDDSDYLSSRWLAQDCADLEKGVEQKLDLHKYIEFQIRSLKSQLEQLEVKGQTCKQRPSSAVQDNGVLGQANPSDGPTVRDSAVPDLASQPDTSTVRDSGEVKLASPEQISPPGAEVPTGQSQPATPGDFNPNEYDINRIIKLLEREQAGSKSLGARERILSLVLLSPLAVAVPAFALFCTGILMLAWNKQPRAVAIFTSATVFICALLLLGFFVEHRRKHVIKKLYLGRPSW